MSALWSSADAYEPYVGRWSRRVGDELLTWLGRPPSQSWIDVGCGTGALTQTVIARAAPRSIVGVDPSLSFVAHARATTRPPGHFIVGSAGWLPLPDDWADTVVSGLVLNFVPDPARAVRDMARVVTPGGTVAAYVWDYAGKMQLMRRFWDAAVELDPAAAPLDEGPRFGLCAPEPLSELFERAGLSNVVVRAIDVPTRFRDFDDYWEPFLGGHAPAPAYVVSLTDERRVQLRELLRARVPGGPDGSIELVARAWAVRGTA